MFPQEQTRWLKSLQKDGQTVEENKEKPREKRKTHGKLKENHPKSTPKRPGTPLGGRPGHCLVSARSTRPKTCPRRKPWGGESSSSPPRSWRHRNSKAASEREEEKLSKMNEEEVEERMEESQVVENLLHDS